MRLLLKISFLFVFAVLAGCVNTEKTEISYVDGDSPKIMLLNDIAVDRAMNNSQKVLSDMGFKLEKFDIANGYLRSKPLGGSQFWELWRGNNIGSYNEAMANVNSIVRVVEMNFKILDGRLYADCSAEVSKLSFTGEPVSGASDMREAFTEASGRLQELSLAEGYVQWVSLGRDIRLEERVLEAIRDKN